MAIRTWEIGVWQTGVWKPNVWLESGGGTGSSFGRGLGRIGRGIGALKHFFFGR